MNIETKILQHAFADITKESCGLILSKDTYIPCKNISDTPESNFKIDGRIYIKYYNNIKYIFHSHINHRHLSKADMELSKRTQTPLCICFLDTKQIYYTNKTYPLLKRPFIHGLFDCYSLVRDYYKQKMKIKLSNYSRELGWWETDENLIENSMNKKHWVEIDDMNAGDVICFAVRSEFMNHLGLYIGNNKMIHHPYDKLSCEVDLNKYRPYIKRIVRYER